MTKSTNQSPTLNELKRNHKRFAFKPAKSSSNVFFTLILVQVFLFSLNVQQVQCDVILFIDLFNFSNPTGALYTGQCCESYAKSNCSQFPPSCDVSLRICIDSYEKTNELSNPDSCAYGSYLLNSLQNLNTFDFKLNPQAVQPFIFNIKWASNQSPRFFLKFFAMDDSSDRMQVMRTWKNKLIDSYVIDFNQNGQLTPSNGLSNQLEWTQFALVEGVHTSSSFRTTLSLAVAIKCATNYFTSSCNVRCVQQDSCLGGHYRCNPSTGEKMCNLGFVDPSTNCVKRDTTIQLCPLTDREFCSSNGFCYVNSVRVLNLTLPTCCCNSGFGGANCQNILSCDMNPCSNGAICQINQTTQIGYCVCKQGFEGKYCEKKIECPANFYGENCSVQCVAVDSCETHQACDYNGRLRCKDGWGPFPQCNKRLINPSIDTECPSFAANGSASLSCLNGASCWNNTCCCAPGFRGPRCELADDLCASSPCMNGAECLSTANRFSCLCRPGFTGIFCQVRVDFCQNATLQCSSAGQCVNFANFSGFECQCYAGYTGRYCENKINFCSSQPCQNRATCVPLLNGYFCVCPTGFTGLTCESPTRFCQSQPCINGACLELANDYICQCNPGWTNAKTCGEDIDECSLGSTPPCWNNGTCLNLNGSYACICPAGFTGKYCQQMVDYCDSSPCFASQTLFCRTDHSTSSYKCVCRAGFTGSRCETPIDYCANAPCIPRQAKTCINYQTTYKCICEPGYAGVNCEVELNECESSPCLNAATCIDQVNGYRCICLSGFIGPQCQTNINPCQVNEITNRTICGQFGTCYPLYFNLNEADYFCECTNGYQGKNCNQPASFCSLYQPCLNNATCQDLSSNNFNCQCASGFTGRFCEQPRSLCDQTPSICNAGTCIFDRQAVNGTSDNFTCLCPHGYTGRFCQTLLDPCLANQCVRNQGFCQAVNLPGQLPSSYTCVCLNGFTGQFCEARIDQCANSPCQNQATCRNFGNYYTCECPRNYYGSNCEFFFACSQSPCSPLGTVQCIDLPPLLNQTMSQFKCNCRVGFSGALCETNINECESAPCLNGGTCVDLPNAFYCQCASNYGGLLCETATNFCQMNPCADGSTCLNLANGFKCSCPLGKTGIYCTESVDFCALLPCSQGGLCINLPNDYRCTCLLGYTGKNCSQLVDQCASNPCQNGASCTNFLNGFYCHCASGFTGERCEQPIDFCKPGANSAPVCLNGGTCINLPNKFECLCANGYTGARCDSFVDLCNATVCQNGALCRTALNGTVYCTCGNGFTGTYCETPIDYCQANTCLNGATCLSLPNSFACFCPANFFGFRCENKLDLCLSQPCRNNGTCVSNDMGFSCQCTTGFTGQICQIKADACLSFPCRYGTCQSMENGYKCNCLQGFTGPQCTELVNKCQTEDQTPTCLNGGTCLNLIFNSSFHCICPLGYSGERCETFTSPCASQPCARGRCIELPSGDYRCQCPIGFTGSNCEQNINECLLNTTCFNNATCIDTIGSYTCRCLQGFTGQYCELTLDSCVPNPCANSALCVNDAQSSFRCVCPLGFSGRLCENVIDACANNPCLNQATCVVSLSMANLFSCTCRAGFTGTLCEQLLDPCESRPCQNNAICINRSTPTQLATFLCACPLGFTGTLCDRPLNPCDKVKCINGGSCVSMGFNEYKCNCPSGFTGLNCELEDSCVSAPCQNGATCLTSALGSFVCNCTANFTGTFCNESVTLCNPNPCLNSATCFESNEAFQCVCSAGFTGDRCETIQTCSLNCLFGNCETRNGTDVCRCLPGYAGFLCEREIRECFSFPCRNNGTCTEPFLNMYSCSCPNGYSGTNCELVNACNSNPCLNGATCTPNTDKFYNCTCREGFTGQRCEQEVKGCSSNPCQNGASCVDQPKGTYVCYCQLGFIGFNCQEDLDECQSEPCMNNGTCSTAYLNMYECSCPQGYLGVNCESQEETCLKRPCENGGTCVAGSLNSTFTCQCTTGFVGNFCEEPVDNCTFTVCTKKFTGLMLNVYGMAQAIQLEPFKQCIIDSWNSLIPYKKLTLKNTIIELEAKRPAIEFTNTLLANRATSLLYSIELLNASAIDYQLPDSTAYYERCGSVVRSSDVYLYYHYWDVSFCDSIGIEDERINRIGQVLKDVWRSRNPDIDANCSCLHVDIFKNLINYYEPSPGYAITKLSYLVYASPIRFFLDRQAGLSRIPTHEEIASALRLNKLPVCESSVSSDEPVLFNVDICHIVSKRDQAKLLADLQKSWETAELNDVVATGYQIKIAYQNKSEFYTSNGFGNRINYFVYVDNQVITRTFALTYNYDKIKERFQSFSPDYKNCSAVLHLDNAFHVISANKLCDSRIGFVENQLNIWYRSLKAYNESVKIVVSIAKSGIEEMVDQNSNFYYNLPIFFRVENEFVKPTPLVYNLLLNELRSYKAKSSTYSSSEYLQIVNPNQVKVFRVALAFKFYLNRKVSRNSLNLLNEYIKLSHEKLNRTYTKSTIESTHQRDVILQGDTENVEANEILAFITNTVSRSLYDAREEDMQQITANLIQFLNTSSSSGTQSDLAIDSNLNVYPYSFVNKFKLLKFSQLFVFYLTNDYLEMSSKDLMILSSWLNEQWNLILKSSSTTIFVFNHILYFDKGNMVIGLNYLVKNQDPLCVDLESIETSLRQSFESFTRKRSLSQLCGCNYQYYQYVKTDQSERPTRYFYTLELIDEVNRDEVKFTDWIQFAVHKAWIAQYNELVNVSLPMLSSKFQLRVGSYGTLTSLVFYTLTINEQPAQSFFHVAPEREQMERELRKLDSDLRVYPLQDSLAKATLSSLYFNAYPVDSKQREILENQVHTALSSFDYLTIPKLVSGDKQVDIVYNELYSGQASKRNISRLYYAYYLNDKLIYPCELVNLYSRELNSTPTDKAFDYMIKARHIDVLFPHGTLIPNEEQFVRTLLYVWQMKNKHLDHTQVQIKLGSSHFYTSIYQETILRANYFITINSMNVNSDVYAEPLIADFNKYLHTLYQVPYLFPNQAYRLYLQGTSDQIDFDALEKHLGNVWNEANRSKSKKGKMHHGRSSLDPQSSVLIYENKTKLYNLNDNYKPLTRLTYQVLIDGFADASNHLFFNPASRESIRQTNISSCKNNECKPALFYDFYSRKSYTDQNEANELLRDLKDAWIIQNSRQEDELFRNSSELRVYSRITHGPNVNKEFVNRIIYAFGVGNGDADQLANRDPTDYSDPSDKLYDTVLSGNVIDRENSAIIGPVYKEVAKVDRVEGIKWWMILIIVIAAILAVVLLAMCLFFICVRRNSREVDERSPFPALSTSSLQFEDKEPKSQEAIDSEEANYNYLSSNQAGNIYKFQPSFDTTLNRTIKSTQRRHLALPENSNDEALSKTTHVYLNSTMVRKDEQNPTLRASSMRLNLPQQYEAKIN